MNQIKLGERVIRKESRPYVIAEIGVNHEGSLDTAKMLIDQCKEGGADAAKFQSYKAHTLASKDSPAYWDTTKEPTLSQFKLFQKHDSFGEKEYRALYEHCKRIGIDFLSTPFDLAAVDYLEDLVPFYKVASADLTCVPLLRKVADTKKPVLLSTGCSTLSEISEALQTLEAAGCDSTALLHCILNYPCDDQNANLGMLGSIAKAFPDQIIGYSDHTLPDESMFVLMTAVSMGAVIIEKHFTHDKNLPGNDHYHAMDLADLKRFSAHLDRYEEVRGATHKAPIPTEKLSRANARRSIVINRDVRAGSVLTEADLTFKRPAHGVSPQFWDEVVGKTTAKDLEEDHVLKWSDIEG